MKRILITLSFIVFAIANVFAVDNYDFSAVCESGQTLYYKISGNKTVTVTYPNSGGNKYYLGYEKPIGNLIIPQTVTNRGTTYSVTSIGEYTFTDCHELSTVTIPNSVTNIEKRAFWYTGLTSLIIPNSVTSIGDEAFSACYFLTSITIPNSVRSIGRCAFYCSAYITTITIPNSVTEIGEGAFSMVKNIIYNGTATGSPWSAMTINGIVDGDFVYSDTQKTKLTAYVGNAKDVTIPNSVTSIGRYAFYLSGVASVSIPNSVTSIGERAFWGVKNIIYDGAATESPWGALTINGIVDGDFVYSDTQKTKLTAYVGNAQVVTIPNTVTSIGGQAFYRCSQLETLIIPNSVTSVGSHIFNASDNLSTVYCEAVTQPSDWHSTWNRDRWETVSCSIIWGEIKIIDDFVYTITNNSHRTVTLLGYMGNNCSIIIPSKVSLGASEYSVTKIEKGAFSGRSDLTSISIPESVTSIDNNIIKNCPNLQFISMHSSTPPTITSSTFNSLDVTFPFYIPCGSLSAYSSANYWKDKNFVEDFVYRLDLEPNDVERGSTEIVTAPTCGGAAVIKAVSNRYFEFTHWSDGNTDNPRSILITQDTKLTANFQYRLVATIESADESLGTVSESSGVFNDITDIEISATPEFGYHFTQWSDGVTANPRVVRLATDTLLQAQFAANPQTITLTSNDETRGTVEGGGVSRYNTLNTIRATATGIYRFGKWSDGNMENPRQILLTSDTALMAIFVEDRLYNVDVTSQDSAKGTVSGTGKYDYGTEVVLQATPAKNCFFVRWNDGETSNPRLLVVEKDFNYQAVFDTLQIFNVRVLASNASLGTVSGSGQFVSGSQATLSATAAEHYVFSQWSDGRTDNPRTVRVIADATYTAVFEPMQYYLKLAQNNANMGMVSGDGVYSYGTVVSCLATPYPNYHFVQWSNGSRDNPYEFVISEDVPLLTAYFAEGAATAMGDDAATTVHVYAHGRTIVVENADAEIFVYDAMGKLICRDAINRVRAELQVNTAGVYIVKVGNVVKRVMVN